METAELSSAISTAKPGTWHLNHLMPSYNPISTAVAAQAQFETFGNFNYAARMTLDPKHNDLVQRSSTMIRSILYESTATTDFPSPEDKDIIDTALAHNDEMDVSGYLVRTRLKYYQVLEGEHDVLEDLLGMIQRDRRHTNVKILSDKTTDKRLFAKWGMGYHLVTEQERDVFVGWAKQDEEFVECMIDYMRKTAAQS